ncbi:IclR family transcriptional regulator [Sinomonas humi]|uniref:IclR family transcriptional regulator n=1 Tax=Sinomonas humi TaxID=1338436 RepID=UPI0009DF14AD|nr:IclR family transcriptional regulator [Sinomonas humi]
MPRLTPAVLRSLDILELFLDHQRLTGAEVGRLTGLPRASVHELLATLAERRYLDRHSDGSYALGVSSFVLGQAYRDRLDLRQAGRQIGQQVAERCQETVNIGVLEGSDVVYLVKIDSPLPVRLVSRAGGRLPASCTAIGKALLSALDADELNTRIPAVLPQLTPQSITDREVLLAQLNEARSAGAAYEAGESSPEVNCVGVPIRDHSGTVVAALSVSVPESRWARRAAEEWTAFARRGAQELSRTLGWRVPADEELEPGAREESADEADSALSQTPPVPKAS